MELGQRALEAMVIEMSFWGGKRVFITGHTGFKGAWLALWLKCLGAEVTGFALDPPTSPSMFDLARVGEGICDLRGDIRVMDSLCRAVQDAHPEIVIHMAAQSLVRYSYEHPVETYATNVMGTVHLLEAVRRSGGVRTVLVVTSDKCYENQEWVWGYRENDSLGGFDPYSNSKGCAELVTSAYRRSFFTKDTVVASARAGNVFGGGDWAMDRLVPDAVRAFAGAQELEIRSPRAIRPWQLVLEPLSAYLMLLQNLWLRGEEVASAWNFGPKEEDARPVEEVIDKLAALWGEGARWKVALGAQPHEAHQIKLDCSKAQAQLGWRPKTSLDEGLLWTIQWYRAWHEGADMRRASQAQIERFMALPGR